MERSQHETNALENELQALKIDKDKQGVYIRELEQKNDDLERGQRYGHLISFQLCYHSYIPSQQLEFINLAFICL